MAYTATDNLTEALYYSLRYFLYSDTDIDVSTVYIANPDIDISSLTPPFIIVRPWDRRWSLFTMPDTEKLAEFYFDLWISCTDFNQQQELPLTVTKKLNAATAENADEVAGQPGIQIYKDFDLSSTGTGSPDTGTKLCEADLDLTAMRAFEVATPEEESRRYMTIISGYWSREKSKDKAFIST